jgi:hypothetical protein
MPGRRGRGARVPPPENTDAPASVDSWRQRSSSSPADSRLVADTTRMVHRRRHRINLLPGSTRTAARRRLQVPLTGHAPGAMLTAAPATAAKQSSSASNLNLVLSVIRARVATEWQPAPPIPAENRARQGNAEVPICRQGEIKRDRSGRLLIPRSQVRSLPGPFTTRSPTRAGAVPDAI